METHLRKLTRREFRHRMQSGALKAAILPVAAIEQHLEHLAMEHDWRSVTAIADAVAKNLQPSVLIAEGLMAGISEHHMRHPGTLTLAPGTFLAVLSDLIDSLVRAGFRNILVLNGHGGNVAPCVAVWDQFVRRFQVNVQFLSYWDLLNSKDAQKLLKSGSRLPQDLPGHAQEFETSVALAAFPENVREEAVADQPDPFPSLATAEAGQEWLHTIISRLTAHVRDIIEGRATVPIPPFHP